MDTFRFFHTKTSDRIAHPIPTNNNEIISGFTDGAVSLSAVTLAVAGLSVAPRTAETEAIGFAVGVGTRVGAGIFVGVGVGVRVGAGVDVFFGVDVGVGVEVLIGVGADVGVGVEVGVGQGSVKDIPLVKFFVLVDNLSYVFPPSGIQAIDPDDEGIHIFP